MRILGLLLVIIVMSAISQGNITLSAVLGLICGIAMIFFDVIVYQMKLKLWFRERRINDELNVRENPPRQQRPYRPKR